MLQDAANTWRTLVVPGDATGVWLIGATDLDILIIGVTAINGLGVRGPTAYISHTVVGKTQAPSDVVGLAATLKPGVIIWTWTAATDNDYAQTEARIGGSSWATAATPAAFTGRTTTFSQPVTATGTYTLRVKHIDTSGNYSTTAASASAVVGIGDIAGVVASIDVQGDNTDYPVGRFLKVNGSLVDSGGGWGRGHTMFTVDPTTMVASSPTTFDTYGAGTSGLIAALAAVAAGQIVVLSTYDASQLDAPLRTCLLYTSPSPRD